MAELQRQAPTTFSIESEGAVGSSAVPQLGAPTAQPAALAQGLSAQAPGVSTEDAKTMQAIMGLASGILAPKVKEEQQRLFIQGVQQAMTGESLDEIIKDKPWYTDIFAPSSALAGARTYTAQKAIADWGAKMAEQMPQLAKQGPEQLQAAATGALQGFLTGDAAADGAITSAVVEQMAPLFKQHAKEHYQHVQKQASEAQIGAWESLGKGYQALAATQATGKGTVSPEDLEAGKARFLAAVSPFADQSDEAFERNVTAFLQGSASAGNFQVVKLFKETGLYDKIDPDKRAALDRQLSMFGREALSKAMPVFAMDVATLVNDMTQDPRGIPEKVAALNAKAAAYTGVTEAELIPSGVMDNIVGRVMVAQRNEADALAGKQRTAADKEQEKLAGLAIVQGQMLRGPGAIDQCDAVGLCKPDDIETVGAAMYSQAKDPAGKAQVLNSRVLSGFKTVKANFTTTLRSPEFQKGVGDMAQVYEGLSDNVKPHYFDEHERALMDRFNAQVRAGVPPEAAWVTSRTAPTITNLGDAKSPASKAIRSAVESANEEWGFVDTLDESSMRMAEALTMKSFKLDSANNPPDVAARRAYAQARANGLDIQGKHVVLNANPKDRPLFTLIGESREGTARAFESVMAQKSEALGASLDHYEAIRVPDRNGKAYVYVSATDKEGKVVSWNISSDEVKAAVTVGVKKDMKASKVSSLTKPVIPDMWEDPQSLIDAAGR